MKRFFTLAFGALAMILVMLVFAAVTLRIAIHGGEVTIPDFSGMTAAEASDTALRKGLDLTIENRFYSTTIPPGRMLSQAPAAGSRVRKGWKVRVIESLGPQQVTIPDVAGQPQRGAAMSLRRNSLDLGTLAHIDAPGDADMVLAQTPPPNAGVDQPRVSLLLSSQAGDATNAIVLPSFVGLSYTGAIRAAGALGIKLTYQDYNAAPAPPAVPHPAEPLAGSATLQTLTPQTSAPQTSTPGGPAPQGLPGIGGIHLDANGAAIATPAPAPVYSGPFGPVTGQKPEPGYRATRGETVKIIFGHAPVPASPAISAAPGSSAQTSN